LHGSTDSGDVPLLDCFSISSRTTANPAITQDLSRQASQLVVVTPKEPTTSSK
jgi:hypothetical protein